ncbi:MAG: response regulator transcription factor [Candidatus Thiodiazotropha sp.]
MTIRALLVEDNIELARTVVDYLALNKIECDFAANGEAGLHLISQSSFHVILLDINLPKMNGYQVCEALRRQGVDMPILMLTARDTLDDKLAGFRAGTDDYLVKPFQMEELVARIHALANRRSSQAKKLRLADLEVDLSTKTAVRAGRTLELTPTGWIILVTLLRNAPNVVTREMLEYAIWQDDPPDSNLLKVHLYRLRQKLDKPFDHPLIHTLANQGFAMREHHD